MALNETRVRWKRGQMPIKLVDRLRRFSQETNLCNVALLVTIKAKYLKNFEKIALLEIAIKYTKSLMVTYT